MRFKNSFQRYLLLILFVFFSCPSGTSSSSSAQNTNTFTPLTLPILSQESTQPSRLFPARDTPFQLQIHDPENKVNSLQIKNTTLDLVFSGSGVSGDKSSGFLLTELSQADPLTGIRVAQVTLQLNADLKNSSALALTAYSDLTATNKLDSFSSNIYVREASKPSRAQILDRGTALPTTAAAAEMFSVNASYDLELEITDEDNWAGAVRITTLSNDLKLSGAQQLQGSVSPFLVELNTLADAQNKRTVDFVLKAEQDVAVANGEISLEILDEQQQSFAPPITSTVYIQAQSIPSRLSVHSNSVELSDKGTQPSVLFGDQATDYTLSFNDIAKDVSKVKLSSDNNAVSISGTGLTGSSGQYELTSFSEPDPSSHQRNASISITIPSSIATNVTLTVEILNIAGNSFSPAIKSVYYLKENKFPTSLSLHKGALNLSSDSNAPTLVESGSNLIVKVNDPDSFIEQFILDTGDSHIAASGTNISSRGGQIYAISGLSTADVNGFRSLQLSLDIPSGKALTSTAIKLTAQRNVVGNIRNFSPSLEITRYFKRKTLPQIALHSENEEISEQSASWATSFVAGSDHDIVLKLYDPSGIVGKVKITMPSNYVLKNAGAATSNVYEISNWANSNPSFVDKTVQLNINSTVQVFKEVTLAVELLDTSGASFSPAITKSYNVMRELLSGWAVKSSSTSSKAAVAAAENHIFATAGTTFLSGVIDASTESIDWSHEYTVSTTTEFQDVAELQAVSADGSHVVVFAKKSSGNGLVIIGTYTSGDAAITWERQLNRQNGLESDNAILNDHFNSFYYNTTSQVMRIKFDSSYSSLAVEEKMYASNFNWNFSIYENAVSGKYFLVVGHDFSDGIQSVPLTNDGSKSGATGVKTKVNNGIDAGKAVDKIVFIDKLAVVATSTAGILLGEINESDGSIGWLHQYSQSSEGFASNLFQSVEVVENKYVLGVIKYRGVYIGLLDKSQKEIDWLAEYVIGERGVPNIGNYKRSAAANALAIVTEDGKVITAVIDK